MTTPQEQGRIVAHAVGRRYEQARQRQLPKLEPPCQPYADTTHKDSSRQRRTPRCYLCSRPCIAVQDLDGDWSKRNPDGTRHKCRP